MSTNIERGTTEKYIDDAAITAKIKTKFAADDIVNATDIKVTTENNKVKLCGKVSSQEAFQHAIDIAKNTSGVSEVIPELEIKE